LIVTFVLASLTELVKTFLEHFTYVALVIVLVLAGMGVPIPEDIPLITGGYLCSEHGPIAKANDAIVDADNDGHLDRPRRRVPRIWLMTISGMVGVLLGDSIVFSIGRQGIEGNNFVARHLRKVMHSKRREKIERHFARHGNLTVFAGRFMPGARSIVFAFAGMSKMTYSRFLLIDGMAAGISVPLFVWVGFHFARDFNNVLEYLERVKHIAIPVGLVLIIGIGVLWYLRRKRMAGEAMVEQA
jgi:membrane protein DedA with SNARE-associated domain